ncbi:MAG TPA: hypothetical protein VLY45_02770 [Nitrospiria bacterium]|nr:hypothetical protein [Nitrospiria bacterium]
MKTNRRSLLVLGLSAYLLCFSAFALYHVYAENELASSHGCQIGEWVQHAQIVFFAVILPSVSLGPLLFRALVDQRVRAVRLSATVLLRGPPCIVLP